MEGILVRLIVRGMRWSTTNGEPAAVVELVIGCPIDLETIIIVVELLIQVLSKHTSGNLERCDIVKLSM